MRLVVLYLNSLQWRALVLGVLHDNCMISQSLTQVSNQAAVEEVVI